MESTILKSLLTQGPFVVLFCWLLFYVLKENSKREEKYQELLDKFADKYDNLKSDLGELKELFVRKG